MRLSITLSAVLFIMSAVLPVNGAKVPAGAELTISFRYKDNNNNLRNKTAGAGYAVLEDGYAATIWIEGPYSPGTPCEIVNYERQNIKLVKVITYFNPSHARDGSYEKPNPWIYHDYNTADFTAALVTAGMYYHFIPSEWPWAEGMTSAGGNVAATDVQRTDRTTGGPFCHATNSVMCLDHTTPWVGHTSMGDITHVPDGVSGATVYPGTPQSFTWDMTDYNGNRVDEGYYLVYVQMSSERNPRTMEGGELVGGKEMVDLETCWDDTYYDDKGHHRVVKLLQFGGSSFTETGTEKKWSGDQYYYMDGNMTLQYTVPSAVRDNGVQRPDEASLLVGPSPVTDQALVSFDLSLAGNVSLTVYDAQGRRVRNLMGQPLDSGTHALQADLSGLDNGLYYMTLDLDRRSVCKEFVVAR